ncbi:putative formate transporter [Lachnellula suecica]|uniref:Putative formate transporter n=1 Tax=Lachnellula suecica TaxID=602035 RepID=A0A8T9C750_9HELO|nr:putative formate transporter [Lachnellula suecica]
MDAFTPQQTIELVSRIAGALMFPIGLVMIVLTGADLYTSNVMFMTTAFLHRRIGIKDLAISWFVSFFGNLAGMLSFMAIIIGYGGVLTDIEAYKQQTINFAIMKAQTPAWHQIFLRAIGANWLVCMAVFLSISAREISSKIIAIWFPTATFVALALDHVVANMFFIPIGIWNGAPFGVGYYIWKSLIPTALGNTVGGGLFVGAIYWYLYLTGEGDVEVSFELGSLATAMEAGGPMGRDRRADGQVIEGVSGNGQHDVHETKLASPGRGGTVEGNHLPHSGGPLHSAVGQELAAEKYAIRKGEDGSGSDKTAV